MWGGGINDAGLFPAVEDEFLEKLGVGSIGYFVPGCRRCLLKINGICNRFVERPECDIDKDYEHVLRDSSTTPELFSGSCTFGGVIDGPLSSLASPAGPALLRGPDFVSVTAVRNPQTRQYPARPIVPLWTTTTYSRRITLPLARIAKLTANLLAAYRQNSSPDPQSH